MPEFEASSFAGSGFEVSSQPQGLGSKLPNSASSRVWVRGLLSLRGSVTKKIIFSFLGSCQFQTRPRAEMDRLLSAFRQEWPFHPCSHHPSEEPASCGVQQETGRDKFTLFSAHHTLCSQFSLGRKIYQLCTLNVTFIVYCDTALAYSVVCRLTCTCNLCTCESSSSLTNS